jgi:hypothetical protein
MDAMSEKNMQNVMEILEAWNQGEPGSLEKLMPLIIDDLRAIARHYFEHESSGHTLQPTALVNELYMKLNERRKVHWESASPEISKTLGLGETAIKRDLKFARAWLRRELRLRNEEPHEE